MITDTASVGFVLGHACPLKCDFCCNDRESVGPGKISRSTIAEVMKAFGPEPSVRSFGFTGGDPFLRYRDIVSALQEARDGGVDQPFHVVTSGYWAEATRTRPVLAELHSLGMDRIVLSYDHEHARWVKPEQIREVCRLAREMGVAVDVWGTFWDDQQRVNDLIPDIEDLANVSNFLVYQGGRAARSGRRPTHNLPESEKYSCGRAGHYLVSIYPDGEAYPCCSGDFTRSAKLSCGNVHKNRPADILANVYSHFHVRIAKELGWGVVYSIIERDFPELLIDLPRFSDVDSACEICRTLNVSLKDKLQPVYAMIEAEYTATMAEFDWDRQGLKESGKFDGVLVTRQCLSQMLRESEVHRRSYLSGGSVVGPA